MIETRKISAFVFLSLYSFPILLFSGFIIMQKIVQFEMTEKLENQSLKEISVAMNELKWEDEGHEAIINGHLFDVSSYSIHNDTVTLKGIFDYEEQIIRDNISTLTHQTNNNESSSLVMSILIMSITPFPKSNIKVQPQWFSIINNPILLNQFYRLQSYSGNLLKPPQIV